MSDSPKRGPRIDPRPAWTTLTDAPLAGLALAREAGSLLAWDEARNVYLIDGEGIRKAAERAPAPILSADFSDDGGLVALLIGGPRLLLLDGTLAPLNDRPAAPGASNLAVDPHGRFVAVATKRSTIHLTSRYGKTVGEVEARQGYSHITFLASEPALVAAAGHTALSCFELVRTGPDALGGELEWEERLLSNVGRLEASGDGSLILASCFNLGIQRYDRRGRNEGSYHIGGTATHAVPDFPGRSIVAATLEGELFLLNQAGNIRWKTSLPRPASALVHDALGRYLIYGLPTGEITRIDLQRPTRARPARPNLESDALPEGLADPSPSTTATGPSVKPGSIRRPAWTLPIAESDEQAESAVLAILDDPPRVAFITRGNRVRVFDPEGTEVGAGPELGGAGRILRTSPGWIAAATDRHLVLYDAGRDEARRVDLGLFEVTHLAIRPERYGVAVIQERDRIGRATASGRWVWRSELRTPVEDLALGPHGLTAVSTEAGELRIYDAAGEPAGRFDASPPEPLLLVEAPDDSAVDGLAWVTLARSAQILRGHQTDGRVSWETPTPWEAWKLQKVGAAVVAEAPDGRAIAFDGGGFPRGQGPAESSPLVLVPGPEGTIRRVVRRDLHLIVSELGGAIHWRAILEGPPGPFAAGRSGVAVMLGRELAFFPEIS